jgi:NADH dehydrogenase
MHRTYHVSRMPTWNRRVRILVDWTSALFFGREVVALGQINDPRADFDRVARNRPPVDAGSGSPVGPGPDTDPRPVGGSPEQREVEASATAAPAAPAESTRTA